MIDATGANDSQPDPNREWWTPREVSNLFRVHITTVYRWIEVEKLPATRISRNLYRIRAADVRKLEAMELEQQGHLRMGEGEPAADTGPSYEDTLRMEQEREEEEREAYLRGGDGAPPPEEEPK